MEENSIAVAVVADSGCGKDEAYMLRSVICEIIQLLRFSNSMVFSHTPLLYSQVHTKKLSTDI